MVRKKKKKNRTQIPSFVLGVFALLALAIHEVADGKPVIAQLEHLIEYISQTTITNRSTRTNPILVDKTLCIELPKTDTSALLLHRRGYVAKYNSGNKIPDWVAWKLTSQRLSGTAKRTDNFLPDPDLPETFRSYHADYSRSRYDRGHMAPAGDMKWDQEAMAESFYMSNICPQAPNLNKGDWRELEETCREWAIQYDTLYIVCGPLFKEEEKVKRVGKSKVAVPHGFFKVLLKLGDSPAAVGFLFPNDDCNASLSAYAVPVDSVEQVSGIDFFPALPDEAEGQLESVNGFSLF